MLLERNNQDLLQLKTQLSCYTCEPKTYTMFEQYTTLKERLDYLFAYNLDVIAALQRGRKMVKNNLEIIAQQIKEFNELKRGVMTYRSNVRSA